MTEVIHEHTDQSSDSGMGFMIGALILIAFVVFIIFYGLPFMRNSIGGGNPQINVPDKIDVNVNGAPGQQPK